MYARRMTKRNRRPALMRIAQQRGVPLAKIARRFGTSRGTVYNWFSGKQTPNTLQSPALAEMLGITRDELDAELRKVAQ